MSNSCARLRTKRAAESQPEAGIFVCRKVSKTMGNELLNLLGALATGIIQGWFGHALHLSNTTAGQVDAATGQAPGSSQSELNALGGIIATTAGNAISNAASGLHPVTGTPVPASTQTKAAGGAPIPPVPPLPTPQQPQMDENGVLLSPDITIGQGPSE